MSKPTRFERAIAPAIEKWCKKNKADPSCVSLFVKPPRPKVGDVTYTKIQLDKDLDNFLDHYGLTPYLRSKPVKETVK